MSSGQDQPIVPHRVVSGESATGTSQCPQDCCSELVHRQSPIRCVLYADPGSLAERRATETVYLAVRYHVYQRVTPAIMVVGIVGNVLSLVLGVRCRPQMSSLDWPQSCRSIVI